LSRNVLLAVWVLAALMSSASAGAQDGPRSRGDAARDRADRGGSANDVVAYKPLPGDAVKRTWDFTKTFGVPSFRAPHGDCGPGIAAFQQSLAAYGARVDEFLGGPTDPKKLKAERAGYVRMVTGLDRDIATYEGEFETAGKRGPEAFIPPLINDVCVARVQQQNLIGIQAMLKAMKRVYPDMSEVDARLAKVDAAILRIGSDANISTHVSANRAASVAMVRMKPPLSTNPTWQGWFRDWFAKANPGATIIKVNLYSADWFVQKNAVTSIPEHRQIGAWIAAKGGDGVCRIHTVDLFQNYVGGAFQASRFTDNGAPQQILCENI
jgi:hypothetical protein